MRSTWICCGAALWFRGRTKWRSDAGTNWQLQNTRRITTRSLHFRSVAGSFGSHSNTSARPRPEWNTTASSSVLESERNLDRVLYLACTRHIHSLLKQRLWRIRQRVLIGLASDLPKAEPADLEVVDAQTMQVYRLIDIP